jgi:hypothetical protein
LLSAINPPEANLGAVSVLLVKVSVVSKATRVRVPVGIVTVPLLLIEEITGKVSVLLVSVCVPVVVTTATPPTVVPAASAVVLLELRVVNAPVEGEFAPTEPLILISYLVLRAPQALPLHFSHVKDVAFQRTAFVGRAVGVVATLSKSRARSLNLAPIWVTKSV